MGKFWPTLKLLDQPVDAALETRVGRTLAAVVDQRPWRYSAPWNRFEPVMTRLEIPAQVMLEVESRSVRRGIPSRRRFAGYLPSRAGRGPRPRASPERPPRLAAFRPRSGVLGVRVVAAAGDLGVAPAARPGPRFAGLDLGRLRASSRWRRSGAGRARARRPRRPWSAGRWRRCCCRLLGAETCAGTRSPSG